MIDKNEVLLHPVTYDQVLLMAKNLNPTRGISLREEFARLLHEKVECAIEEFDANIDTFLAEQAAEENGPVNPLTDEQTEALAQAIYQLLLRYEMWMDVYIYYNGKRMGTSTIDDNGKEIFRYNGEPFLKNDIDPHDYFQYAGPTLSMSFEGPMYHAINHGANDSFLTEFNALLREYGLYYELGHAWNLSVYPV